MLKMGVSILGLVILLTVVPLPNSLRKFIPFQQTTITIDPSVSYQTMLGWEAVSQAGQIDEIDTITNRSNINPGFAKYQNQLFDLAVDDLGLNRVRLELRSGAENPIDNFTRYINGQITFTAWKNSWYQIVNDNNDPQIINPSGFQFSELDYSIDTLVIPIRQRLLARGEKLYLNLCYVDFGASSFEHKNAPEEYAEFILTTFLHMRDKYGFTPDAMEMILEPDTNADWNATQIGNCLVAAGNRLRANGFNPDFVAPSCTSMFNALTYFDQLVQIPGVTKFISEISYHRYGGATDTALQGFASRGAQYKIDTAHLELIGANQNDLHSDLTIANNSSWEQFALAFPTDIDDGGVYYLINQSNLNNPTLTLNSRAKFLRQYFKFIRSGALRIKATSTSGTFTPAAFINTDGKFVVVVRTFAGGNISLQGLPAGTYGVKYTTPSQYDIDVTDISITAGQALNTSIPSDGVITIYGKSAPSVVSVDASSYARASSPGQIEAAFGTGFPPGTNIAVSAPATPLPTAMSNVSVRVNNVLAPLFFVGVGGGQGAGAFQVNYQIPYQTPPGLAKIEVLNNDVPVSTGFLIVSGVAPGVFTIAATGKGQAVAINQDFSLNGDPAQNPGAKPESRGKVVTIFANGPGGQFINPANGQALTPISGVATPASPFYATASTPIVTVGDAPATVTFSGLTPGLVGLWQLNMVIPLTAPVGNSIPVFIKINRRVTNLTTIAVN
ncbi:MAG: hypothetical protein JST85_11020 [Acidobacteria bacterium]|nr:hypothetical protein [Acidobacteriota bacterium]